jgi:hypothetical protein
MARYRKIDTRMWGDSRFRELSSPKPSGKYLWIFLLTGPQTSNIPGLFHAGEMALSEELEWSVEAFREAFGEVFRKGLAEADWKARVVWVPNAVKYNQPESPNVVKSWRHAWDEIPECALKAEAHERLKAFMKGLGEGFAKAFAEACGQPLPNQEQEQEQLKTSLSEQKSCSDVGALPSKKPKAEPSREATKLATLLKAEILRNKGDFKITQAQERSWAATADRMLRLDRRNPEEAADLIQWAQRDEFWMTNVLSMDTFRKKFDQLALKAKGKTDSKVTAPVPLPANYIPASEQIRREREQQRQAAVPQ